MQICPCGGIKSIQFCGLPKDEDLGKRWTKRCDSSFTSFTPERHAEHSKEYRVIARRNQKIASQDEISIFRYYHFSLFKYVTKKKAFMREKIRQLMKYIYTAANAGVAVPSNPGAVTTAGWRISSSSDPGSQQRRSTVQ